MTLFNPYVWLGIALACVMSFFGGCSAQKERSQKQFDAHLAADAAATAKFNAETAKKDAANAEKLAQAGFQYERDKAHAMDQKDHVIADLRAGKLSLRPQWRCPASPVPDAPEGARSPDDAADLRETDAGSLVSIAAACDAQVKGLQAVITTDRE